MNDSILLRPTRLGNLSLKNHAVMAPMTRSRALGNVPNELMATYYRQRAGAGLIITEGTSPSPNGLGYPRIPGIFNNEQVQGWKLVTKAVHAAGGRIFAQLMHTGRITHPANLPAGGRVLGPSAVAAKGTMVTDAAGVQPLPVPQAMTAAEVHQAIEEFGQAARNADRAGFDGVELHGANGYLIEQFLNPGTNLRTDEFGGSFEKRARFAIHAARAAVEAIGPGRVGIRFSPYGVFNDIPAYDEVDATYAHLARELGRLQLAYLHLVDHSSMGAPAVPPAIVQAIRAAFPGTIILSGGYDLARAEADLTAGRGDLIAFARPFLANPDLVERFRLGAALNQPAFDKFYTPGPEGYTDYPTLLQPAVL